MPEPVLSVRELSAAYGPHEVLHGVSLEVGPGEIVALIGANGAGKSTTLDAICGLVPRVRYHSRSSMFSSQRNNVTTRYSSADERHPPAPRPRARCERVGYWTRGVKQPT